jgi:hypothetical protein
LQEPDSLPSRAEASEHTSFTLAPSVSNPARRIVSAPPGGGRIRELRLHPASTDPAVLRRTLLAISFDGEPSVLAPLGDFFGSGPGLHPYASLPFVVEPDGTLISRWPMPFQHEAEIELRSLDGVIEVQGTVEVEPAVWDDASMHFHAQWHPVDAMNISPPRDWHVIALDGAAGVFVGLTLNVFNPDDGWWGEGDEKIYFDDATFPDWFGTGTEDYFGYGWCSPNTFSHPYHAQTFSEGTGTLSAGLSNRGHTSLNRWHVTDAIPFDHQFVFDLEVLHWGSSQPVTVDYDAVAYWYAIPGGSQNIGALDPSAVVVP